MNKLLQSIKAGEEEFRRAWEGANTSWNSAISTPQMEEMLSFLRSNTIKLLEEEIKWLEGRKTECPNHNPEEPVECYGYDEQLNQSLDETISMLRETIKELKGNV
jgi:hypothetical protein